MKKRADWLAWSLQFLSGFFIGALCSLMFIRGRRSIPLIEREASPVFAFGAALIGAALASYYGDQLWSGGSYFIIPPLKRGQSRASRRASLAVGCVGGILVLIAFLRPFGLLR